MADNLGKVTRFPRYEVEGTDDFTEREGCVCRACRRTRLHRRHDDRVEARVIARRLTVIALVAAASFGALYALGGLHTFAGAW